MGQDGIHKENSDLLARGLIAHHGAFLVATCVHGCAVDVHSPNSWTQCDSSGDLNSNGALRKPKAKVFWRSFDIVGGLFGDSETSPSSSPNVNSNISPGDARTDTDHLNTRAPTGDYKVDGWWSGLEAAVSDADHVVIEHRHLFEIVCLVLFLLMATAFCVACCCCYSGKQGSSDDYGVGSQGSNGLHKSDAGYLDAVGGFDRYHDEGDRPVDDGLVINGDPSFNGNRTILKNDGGCQKEEKALHGKKEKIIQYRKVSKRKKKQNKGD